MWKDTACGISTFCKVEIMAGPKTDAQFHFMDVKKYFFALMVLSFFKLSFKKPPAMKATQTGLNCTSSKFQCLEKLMLTHHVILNLYYKLWTWEINDSQTEYMTWQSVLSFPGLNFLLLHHLTLLLYFKVFYTHLWIN